MSNAQFAGRFLWCSLLLVLIGCKKDEPVPNQLPDTHISVTEINLTGEHRLNSLVSLHWWGTDADGFVNGFELSFDQQNWFFTQSQDSTFLFSITSGSDTVDIDLWVRAIDNEGTTDETPAYLKIPVKNSPPEVNINFDLSPADTAFTVVTLAWDGTDPDGINTIKSFELKINDGAWVAFSPFKTAETLKDVITIVPNDPKQSGAAEATLYFDDFSQGPVIDGLMLNQLNTFYLRAVDVANSASNPDTLENIHVRGQSQDLLVIGASAAEANTFYKSKLGALGIAYDFIDFSRAQGKNQPRIWSPTFNYMLSFYDQVVFYGNDAVYINAQTNAQDILLEYASTSIQQYVNDGGKLLVSSSLPNGFSTGSALFGILPVDSLSTSPGQARLPIDSMAIAQQTGYPDLTASNFMSGLDPVYPSTDAEVVYTANLTHTSDWVGPDIVAVRRKQGANTNLIFFSVEIHKLNQAPGAAEELLDHIIHTEFNW